MSNGPLALMVQMAGLLEDLEVPYVVGGSMASSLVGEPRTTVDVDIAVELDEESGNQLFDRTSADFYVPRQLAEDAIKLKTSFNIIDLSNSLKVDLFVLGDGLLDRMQMQRRVRLFLAQAPDGIWVTSPEDQILRKLDWFAAGGSASERQWRDVVGIMRTLSDDADVEYLTNIATELRLDGLLERALVESAASESS